MNINFINSSGCLRMFSTSIRFLYLSFSSVNLSKKPVLASSHGSAAGKESNHWAAGLLRTEPNNAFLRASYAFCASPAPGLSLENLLRPHLGLSL